LAADQKDRIREQWLNLTGVNDMAIAVQTVAKFGQPRLLSDMKPAN
jgi:hypothetical protein